MFPPILKFFIFYEIAFCFVFGIGKDDELKKNLK